MRAAAFVALCRLGAATGRDAARALADESPWVRRSACELVGGLPGNGLCPLLLPLLGDAHPGVLEAACFAAGELGDPQAVPALAEVARRHEDPLCREAAVAALGAIGDDAGRGAVLDALGDVATVRRRAVIALVAFEGDDVDAALRARLEDHDWQVRQAAEELLGG